MSQTTATQFLMGQFAALGLPAWSCSMDYRVASYHVDGDPARTQPESERCLYVFWHEFIASLISRWGWCHLTLLVSQHRDAEWLNQTAARMGFRMARGSSTRGGPNAIRRLKQLGNQSSLVITPDGPRGPRRQMAPGAAYVASQMQMPIVPIGVGLSRAHRLKTWDRFAIPLPLSRVRVIFGPKLRFPMTSDRDELEAYTRQTGEAIEELTQLAQDWADRKTHLSGYKPRCRWRPPSGSRGTEVPAEASPLRIAADDRAA